MSKYVLGSIHKNKLGDEFIIEKVLPNKRYKIKFLDEHEFKTEVGLTSLSRGSIKNPFRPIKYDRGFFGVGSFTSKDREYTLWNSMMTRAYDEKYHKNHVSYKKTKVKKDWFNYQTFAEDINSIYGFDFKDENGRYYHLDKDILSKGKKVYSKDTCLFIPSKINTFLNQNKTKEGGLPTGVKYRHQDGRYEARISIEGELIYLGSCLTIELARDLYVKARNKRAKELAVFYKDKVDQRVIDMLENYNETDYSK